MKKSGKNSLEKQALSELACEDAIISDKQRFGRVRTSMMKHLRSEHGEEIANRVLSRINKRASNGSSEMKESLTKSKLEYEFN
ncbi:hypothetical protein [Nitrosopumilus sp.]|uniref:hypothetical protein n=1 Tax=Nitrosopumilus sp. TaxID=2024843 RepID=UPI00247DBA7B|nr:hypothetical protein [Nitrosopumilus sp.]MCV0430495.1 hypothetical protein [Nitrosopumilus sp.]